MKIRYNWISYLKNNNPHECKTVNKQNCREGLSALDHKKIKGGSGVYRIVEHRTMNHLPSLHSVYKFDI